MKEHIYAFEINDGFNKKDGSCPFCGIFAKLEDTELDLILGASMMEPEIRQITNKKGFCPTHYRKMFPRKNRLGMALTMESHLDELKKVIRPGRLLAKDPAALEFKAEIRTILQVENVTFLHASDDPVCNSAAVLREWVLE